jgi:DNA-binding response OmpR family regulator
MSTESTNKATILIVDDELEVADSYAFRLKRSYDVQTAYGGQEAVDAVDEDVDVVLLDRRMPNMSGDEALQAIREAGYDCRVIMITAIEPEFDIVEMSFDDYLCKPIEQGTLQQAIESQLTAKEYDETVSDLFRATSKIAVLEAEKTAEELASSAEYQRLKEIVDDTRGEANSLMSEFDDFESAFKAIDRSSD